MTTESGSHPVLPLIRRMTIRDPEEAGRTSTTLELFFDLVFVVTISSVAAQWHHALADGHWAQGLVRFVEMVFGTWWAWMGFTWFANFFDTDDVPYRLLVLVQLLASLGLATGMVYVFKDGDYRVVVSCYVVIRVVMASQWVRAGKANPTIRRYCRRWAVGICFTQLGWVAYGFSRSWSAAASVPFFIVGATVELGVPIWAHRLPPEETAATHPEHAAERYGLFALIILGEMVLVASDAFNTALADHRHLGALIGGGIAGAVLAFSLWWLYFGFLGEYDLANMRTAFIWGYGHYFVYGALTAIGGALAALLAQVSGGDAALPNWGLGLALALPVGIFLAAIALLRQVSEWATCNRWLRSAAAIVAIGVGLGSISALWAIVATCAATAAFLASEIVRKGKAAVRRPEPSGH